MVSARRSPRTSATTSQFADGFFDERFRALIDTFAERAGIEVTDDDRLWPEYDPPEVAELDLVRAGISTVLWTTGYAPDYGWLDLPILDEFGVPRHVRGVSEVPGLSFIGLLWQHNNGSANLLGVAVDAAYLASQLVTAPRQSPSARRRPVRRSHRRAPRPRGRSPGSKPLRARSA